MNPTFEFRIGRVGLALLCLAISALTHCGYAQIAPITVQNGPFAVAVNPITAKAYVANQDSDSITVIDGAATTDVQLASGAKPYAIAVNAVTNKVYIACGGTNQVAVLDGSQDVPVATYISVGVRPIAIAADPATNKVYTANTGDNTVSQIDASVSPAVVTSIAVGPGVSAIAVNPVTDKIYVANHGGSSATVIDASVTPATTTNIKAGSNPVAVAVDPIANKAYIANEGSNNVTVIDASNNTTTVRAGGTPIAIAVNPVTGNVYVANVSDGTITVIGPQAGTITAGTYPTAIAINPLTNHIFIANQGSGNVTIVNGTDSTVLLTQPVGSGPSAVATDPVNGRVYITNHGDATVTALNDALYSTVKTLPTGQAHPFTTVVNAEFHKAYVANVDAGTLTVINTADDTYTTSSTIMTKPVRLAADSTTGYVFALAAGGYDPSVGGVWVFDENGTALVTTPIPFVATYGPQPPSSIAVDSITHSVFATSDVAGNTSIIQIDGSAAPFPVIGYPFQTSGCPSCSSSTYEIAINPANHEVYIGARDSGDLWIFDDSIAKTLVSYIGQLSGLSTGAVRAMRVNSTTNKIYTSGLNSSVLEIDGDTNAITQTISTGSISNLWAMAVNEVTNKVFVGSFNAPTLGVIDVNNNYAVTAWPMCGSDTVRVTSYIEVDPATNVVYATHDSAAYVTALDGTNPSNCIDIPVGSVNRDLSIDPVTHKVYVPNNTANSVSIINAGLATGGPTSVIAPVVDPLTVTPDPFVTKNSSPSFTITVTSPIGYPTTTILYYYVDEVSPLVAATPTSVSGSTATFAITTQVLGVGGHVLTVYPAYGDEGGNNSSTAGTGNSPNLGPAAGLAFTVEDDTASKVTTTTSVVAEPNPQSVNSSVSMLARVVPSATDRGTPSGTVAFEIDGVAEGSAPVSTAGLATFSFTFITSGVHAITATYSGDSIFLTSSGTTTVTIAGAPTSIRTLRGNDQVITYGQAFSPLVATVLDGSNIAVSNASVNFVGSTGSGLSFSPNPVTSNVLGRVSTTPTQSPEEAGVVTATATSTGVTSPGVFTLTTEKAPLTVTSNATRLYGQPDPVFAVTYTGFVNGDTDSAVGGAAAITPTSTISSPVGMYPLNVGLGTLSAANYSITPANGVLTITQASTTVVLTGPATSVYGDQASFRAVVGFGPTTAPGPSGTVSFYDGGSLLATLTLNGTSFEVVFETSSLQAGTHNITATYNGDENWGTSTGSASVDITQAPGLTVTVSDATRAASQPNPSFTYSVTGDLVNGDTAETAVTGGTFSAYAGSTPGSYPITVSELVAPNYALILVPGTLTVTNDPGTPTTTVLAATPSSSMYGDVVTLTGTVTSSSSGSPPISGTVNFYEGFGLLGRGTIANGVATFATSTLSAGTHLLFATYDGDLTYSSSRSNIIVVTVAKKQAPGGGAALTLTVQNETRNYGEANPEFSYVPSGTLVNGDTYDKAIIGVPTYTTSATPTSPVGSNYPITLSGVVSRNYEITTVPGNLTIVPVGSTTTLTASPTSTQYGDPVTLNATVAPSSATGLVNFSEGNQLLGTATLNTSGGATLTLTTLSSGTHAIVATYLGDNNVGQSSSPEVSVTVAKKIAPDGSSALIVTANNATRQFLQRNPAFTYTATGTLLNGDTYATAITGQPAFATTANISSPVGSYPITVSQLNSANYVLGYASGTLAVTQAQSKTTINAPSSSIFGAPVTLTAAVSLEATGQVTFYDGTTSVGTATVVDRTASLIVTSLAAGIHSLTASYSGDTNYFPSTSSVATLVITASPSDFAIANQTPAQRIPPGASATFTIAINSTGGAFTLPVSLTATNLPTGATYTFTPASVVPGTAGATSQLSVMVPSQSASQHRRPKMPFVLATMVLPFAFIRRLKKQRKGLLLWLIVTFAILASETGCGAGGYFGQPQQIYVITVTGTNGSLVHSTTATLTVE